MSIEETLTSLRTRPPRWVNQERLPALRLRAGGALSAAARRGLVSDLKAEGTAGSARHARKARALIEDEDCAALLKVLLESWVSAGQPPNDRRWLLFAMGILGDEVDIDQLGDRVYAESRAKQHRMASHCVNALARSPHPAASSWLARLARSAPSPRLRSEAWLARLDRLDGVPVMVRSHGFDPHGMRPFSLGGRMLELRLQPDGTLHIFEGRRRLKSMPRARKRDDAAAVAAARDRFASLKASISADLSDTIAALTEVMITGQPLTGWRALLQAPIPHFIVRGLIWEALIDGEARFRFLLTDEGDAVDTAGADRSLEAVTAVRPVHPIHLDAAEADLWRSLLLEAAASPPFAQLDRSVHRPLNDERPFGSLLANRAAINPWHLARTLTARGYYAERSYRIESAVKTIGPYCITIRHDPYSPFERSMSLLRLQQITLQHGQTILPHPPAVIYSEIAADLTALQR